MMRTTEEGVDCLDQCRVWVWKSVSKDEVGVRG